MVHIDNHTSINLYHHRSGGVVRNARLINLRDCEPEHQVNLEFDTLDTPDVFWDYEESEPLYKETRPRDGEWWILVLCFHVVL